MMKKSFKQVDAWGQLIFTGIVVAILPFMLSIFFYGYIAIGLWQFISGAIYLFGGTLVERRLRKRYWITVFLTLLALISCLYIKSMGVLFMYLLWFAPAILAIWYLLITVREAQIFGFLSKKQ